MKLKQFATIGALSTTLFAVPQLANADAFYEAMSSGKVKMDIRTRLETVDQEGFEDAGNESDTAEALTIRTRLGYETGTLLKSTAYVEMEDIRVVGGMDDYGTATAGYPTIADPRSTELNQAYLINKTCRRA